MKDEQINSSSSQPDERIQTEIENNVKPALSKRTVQSYISVIVGSLIYSVGIVWILQIGGFFSGGVTGTSQLIVGLIEKFGGSTATRNYLGVLVGIINVPLVLFGWRGVSKRFAVLTVVSIVIQTVTMSLLSSFTVSPLIHLLESGGDGFIDVFRNGHLNFFASAENLAFQEAFKANMQPGTRLVLAIIGGGFTGIGASFCLKGGGSTGGMDIVANYLMVKKKVPFSRYQSLVDGSIIVLSALISIENVLYTLIRLVVYIKTIEQMYRIYRTTRLEVITTKSEELRLALLKRFYHGMTIYDAIGGFTLGNKRVIEIYVSSYEIHDYMRIINHVDPNAFVVATNVKLIKGNYIQKTIV